MLRADDGFRIILLADHMVDVLTRGDAYVALNVALARGDLCHGAEGRVDRETAIRKGVDACKAHSGRSAQRQWK